MPSRDFDRIREILIYLEEKKSTDGRVHIRRDEFFKDSDAYQIELMAQAGFVEADAHVIGSALPGRLRITFSGHDYLDAVRSPSVWEKTKATVAEQGGSAAFEIVKSLATAFAKKQIEDRTGLKL